MKLFIIVLALYASTAFGKMSIVTTTTNLASLVEEIGGDLVKVESLCKGFQDPHFLEAKPSYTFKLSKADLLLSVGASLEVGWLPLIIRGSRNPELKEGAKRHFIATNYIDLADKITGTISRSQGDVHPEGNPHILLSPSNAIKVASALKEKLSELDSKNSGVYEQNFKRFSKSISEFIQNAKKVIPNGLKVVSYHQTLTYFYKEFGINNVDVLEPKPGVPPSAAHVIKLIKLIKEQKIKKIIVENYFDETVAKRIKKDVPEVKIYVVPVAVGGVKTVNSLLDLYNHLKTVMEK